MPTTKLFGLCILAVTLLCADANIPVLGLRGRGRSLLDISQCNDLSSKCVTTTCNGDGTVSVSVSETCIKASGTISNIRLSDGTNCLFTGDVVGGNTVTKTVSCGSTLTLVVHDGSFNNLPGCLTGAPTTPTGCPSLPADPGCKFCKATISTPACATSCNPSDSCHTSTPQGCACVESLKTCTVSINADKPKACPGETVAFTASISDCSSSPLTVAASGTTLTADASGKYNYQVPTRTTCGGSVTATATVCGDYATTSVTAGATTALSLAADKTSACPGASITLTPSGGCASVSVSPGTKNSDGTYTGTLGSSCGTNTFTATDACGTTASVDVTATDSVTTSWDSTSCAPIFTSACTGLITNPTPSTSEDKCAITKTYTVSDQCGKSYSDVITFTGVCPA